MAQVWIREYDAKREFFKFIGEKYKWFQIKQIEDLESAKLDKNIVIKPDMLFGKRWKYGLVWVNLDKEKALTWLYERFGKEFEIEINWKQTKDKLNTFLAEPFIPHNEEYYVSFDTGRDWDIIRFSESGWVDVEENWDKVKEFTIPVTGSLDDSCLEVNFWINDQKLINVIQNLFKFFREFGCVYLEVNPFCFDRETGWVVILDMVCKLDDTAHFLQKDNWKKLEFPNSFGYSESEREAKIKELDKWTWASLKFKVLNPNARIWTLLSWGGWSLIITDTIWSLGYTEEIWNYWECSWDPDKDNTREYTKLVLEQMLENKIKWKYLVIWWAIANFTRIDKTFTWVIEALKIHKDEIIKQDVKILVRRWWINEQKGLKLLKEACEDMWFQIQIADSKEYMTNILKEIKL